MEVMVDNTSYAYRLHYFVRSSLNPAPILGQYRIYENGKKGGRPRKVEQVNWARSLSPVGLGFINHRILVHRLPYESTDRPHPKSDYHALPSRSQTLDCRRGYC
jgi:hypothetical protein